jgi:hypothetical protein
VKGVSKAVNDLSGGLLVRKLAVAATLALAVLAVTLTGSALAQDGQSGAQGKRHHRAGPAVLLAAYTCAQERKSLGVEAFQAKYGKPHAFRKCVKAGLPAARAKLKQAREDCAAERKADPKAFRAKYGKGPKHRHAFRRCVISKVKPAPATAS